MKKKNVQNYTYLRSEHIGIRSIINTQFDNLDVII